ncbi:hypothetical protein MtrunA17_Chr7g0270091 [Medicago truncatula]|uniref:Uncharacterized protein n=1 Tax=Medicago truncatula TaxID=3880 RepID=A0A396H8D0_MEDTR|nr:hypothetical protein MtrunA17_Chr7g0270091 [Medicago truncatula]
MKSHFQSRVMKSQAGAKEDICYLLHPSVAVCEVQRPSDYDSLMSKHIAYLLLIGNM